MSVARPDKRRAEVVRQLPTSAWGTSSLRLRQVPTTNVAGWAWRVTRSRSFHTKTTKFSLSATMQVWPPNQFFLFAFWKKNVNLPGGQIYDPPPIREVSIALFHSFQQLIRLGPLKGFFKLTLLHKPLNNLASNIGFQTSEIQGQFQGRRAMDSVWYNRKNLEFVLVEKPCPWEKHTFLMLILLDCEKLTEWNWIGDHTHLPPSSLADSCGFCKGQRRNYGQLCEEDGASGKRHCHCRHCTILATWDTSTLSTSYTTRKVEETLQMFVLSYTQLSVSWC